MLTTGLSAVKQIFVCDEGVMGFHNDRGTGGKMPADDSCKVILFTYVLYVICKWLIIVNSSKSMDSYKVSFVPHIPAAFSPAPQSCTSSTLLRPRPKSSSGYASLSSTFIMKQALTHEIYQTVNLERFPYRAICRR